MKTVRHNGGAAVWCDEPRQWAVWRDADAMDDGEPANDFGKGPLTDERARQVIESAQQDFPVGAAVLYEAVPGKRFRGVVAREPWLLGDGKTWVTKLTDMELAYQEWTRTCLHVVHGASLNRLTRI